MQVAITCRHGSIGQELRDYITRKAEKLVRYLDRVSEIDVTIEFEGTRVSVEGEDAGATFDKTLHKMEHQVHRLKEKRRDHRHNVSLSDASQTPPAVEPETKS